MFTISDLIFGSITHTSLHQAKLDKLRSNNIVVPRDTFKIVGTDNAIFHVDENINTIHEAINQYSYHDVRPTDNVLDIGACIGAFSLNICQKVNHVYAVEPIFIDELNRNIELNNAKNITVLDCALGSGDTDIQYNGHIRTIRALPLNEIIELCGDHIDFIKCDCEGGEWCMTLPDIFNIRRMEIEAHNFNGMYKFRDFENLLMSSGFDYNKKILTKNLILISAKNRYID